MKVNKLIGFAALAFMLAVISASCVKTDDGGRANGPVALMKVDATLGVLEQGTVTRAVAQDPTLTNAADRAAEGHAMSITIGGLAEAYKFENGRFVPQATPVFFPGLGDEAVEFWFGDLSGTIAGQDGTAAMLLAADALTATTTLSPASYISGIRLTHINSLIEVVLGMDPDDVDDVMIGGVGAYNIPQTNRYIAIIEPGISEFKIALTYKGVPDLEIVVDKDAISGSVKEFTANNRYVLNLGIDDDAVELRLLAISIARWAEAGNVSAGAGTTIEIDGDSSSDGLYVKFTDGTDLTVYGAGNLFRFYYVTPGLPKVIYSVRRMSGVIPVGSEILIGRREGETIYLKLSGDTVVFRDAVDGSVPVGTYAEFALINSALNGQYVQEADLDLLGFSVSPSDAKEWWPIGGMLDNFTGTFDGGGFKIENLLVNLPMNSFAGLFGYCRNSTLENIHVASGSITGYVSVGGICGCNFADDSDVTTISDCVNEAMVTGFLLVGGVCGNNNAGGTDSKTIIQNSSNTGNIKGSIGVGGVCGENRATESTGRAIIAGCTNSGTVALSEGAGGGICGINQADNMLAEATISDCNNSGVINGNTRMGGICGESTARNQYSQTLIQNCVNTGSITGTSSIGGVCGDSNANYIATTTVSGCSNSGSVSGEESIGGICGISYIGSIGAVANISDCTNSGTVSASSKHGGGISGRNLANDGGTVTISNCSNSGTVNGKESIGGVCGNNHSEHEGVATISDCTNSGSISGSYSQIGGICGYNYSFLNDSQAKVFDCTNTGSVSGRFRTSGICGYNHAEQYAEVTVSGCANSGIITGTMSLTGGVCGSNITTHGKAIVSDCINSGTMNGVSSLGGIVGHNYAYYSGTVTISGCTNSGKVTGTETNIGGVCGGHLSDAYGLATILNCINTGEVSGNLNVGGICGETFEQIDSETIITECYSVAKISGGSQVGGLCGLNHYAAVNYCFWGKANDADSSPTVAFGKNSGQVMPETFEFGAATWPGSPATPGFWEVYPTGKWESLGAWGGSPQSSTYPKLNVQ